MVFHCLKCQPSSQNVGFIESPKILLLHARVLHCHYSKGDSVTINKIPLFSSDYKTTRMLIHGFVNVAFNSHVFLVDVPTDKQRNSYTWSSVLLSLGVREQVLRYALVNSARCICFVFVFLTKTNPSLSAFCLKTTDKT